MPPSHLKSSPAFAELKARPEIYPHPACADAFCYTDNFTGTPIICRWGFPSELVDGSKGNAIGAFENPAFAACWLEGHRARVEPKLYDALKSAMTDAQLWPPYLVQQSLLQSMGAHSSDSVSMYDLRQRYVEFFQRATLLRADVEHEERAKDALERKATRIPPPPSLLLQLAPASKTEVSFCFFAISGDQKFKAGKLLPVLPVNDDNLRTVGAAARTFVDDVTRMLACSAPPTQQTPVANAAATPLLFEVSPPHAEPSQMSQFNHWRAQKAPRRDTKRSTSGATSAPKRPKAAKATE